MKKLLIIGSIFVVALVALGIAGFAYAQTQPPTQPDGWRMGGFRGQGMGRGMMAPGSGMPGGFGGMHTYMVNALASRLGLTPETLQARITDGETPWEIAKANGLTDDQIQQLMEESHDEALKQAVAAGVLTQEQADWMDAHMEEMWQNGGTGCPMGGRHGRVVGQYPGG
jgi:hypothetical protein